MTARKSRYEALVAADAGGTLVAPAALLIEHRDSRKGLSRLLAIGTPDQVRHHPAWNAAKQVSLPHAVLIPGLVNAHAHLDLTHIGPQPFDAARGFTGWIEMIRAGRLTDPAAIARSVREGIELCRAGGTVAIGDIAGAAAGRPNLTPLEILSQSPLAGVSFVEFFGIGKRLEAGIARVEELAGQLASLQVVTAGSRSIRAGLQPHAPNSVDLRLYLAAAKLADRHGFPLCTHLAETRDEREFVAKGTGPQRRFLEDIGLWDGSVLERVGRERHPVQHLVPALEAAPFLLAHVNDCDDAAIETLARTGASVVYCPRASEYFGAAQSFGPHRYREMLAAGINVCLGTDSVVNLSTAAASPVGGGISVLDEARLLFRRDGADPRLLLAMATTHGALALGIEPASLRLVPDSDLLGLIAVEVPRPSGSSKALEAVLACDAPATLLVDGHGCVLAGRG